MKKKLFIVLFVFLSGLTTAYAKEYVTLSGAKVEVPETRNVIWKSFTLPSGMKYVAEQLLPIALAADMTLKDEIIIWIKSYAKQYKVSEEGMIKLADCESKFDPKAYNPQDISYKTGKPLKDNPERFGLYQFSRDTFIGDEKNPDIIWDWKLQIEQTAKLLAKGQSWRWPWCWQNRVLK